MKIIKMGKAKITNLKALSKGNGCPCCGETKRSIEYGYDFNHKGIARSAKPKEYKTGFFKKRYWRVNEYHCLTCGCIWEGEPCEYNKI